MPKRKRTSAPAPGPSDATVDPSIPSTALAPESGVNGIATAPTQSKVDKRRKIKEEAAEENLVIDAVSPRRSAREASKVAKAKVEKIEEEESEDADVPPAKATPSKSRKKSRPTESEDSKDDVVNGHAEEKVVRKRKTKEEKEAEAMPLAARTIGHKLFIGAHVSSAGGVHNAPLNSLHIGANAFALFLKSQRKWANPPLAEDACTSFHGNCEKHTYDQTRHVVPHGSYLVNLAHTDKARTDQAYAGFLDDLKRCESLGIRLYNFHPGVANSVGGDRPAAIKHLAANINRAHRETSTVVTLLENMAAGGNVLGSTFEDLRDIIALVDDKQRVGVCLDTCHAFAGGYDLRSPEAFHQSMNTFQEVVGFQYLRALHLNDSKAPFASHRDLHANIGTGFLGLRAFHNLVNDERFMGLPLILETPIDSRDDDGNMLKDEKGKDKEDKGIWAREIKLLESLVGMDTESEEFLKMEAALARRGAPERKRLMEQIERKQEKEKAKAAKGKGKGKKRKKTDSAESADDDSSDLSDADE